MIRWKPATFSLRWMTWLAPWVGASLGFLYGLVDREVILESLGAPAPFRQLDRLLEFTLPAILGLLAGLLINHARRQRLVNRLLSAENAQFQRHLLTQTLGSHILHEIRNPLHNVGAVVEGWYAHLPPEEVATLQRNIEHLQAIIKQLSRWGALDDALDLREFTSFSSWFDEFERTRIRSQLQQEGVTLGKRLQPVTVAQHPLLLEQCLLSLFNNALEAIRRGTPSHRSILISASLDPEQPGFVEIRLSNTGELYPKETLAKQGGEPIESGHGLGLGLVLAQRTLAQVGGTLRLANEQGRATATLRIPGEAE